MAKGTRLQGRHVGGSPKELPKDPTPTLTELGIDKKLYPAAPLTTP